MHGQVCSYEGIAVGVRGGAGRWVQDLAAGRGPRRACSDSEGRGPLQSDAGTGTAHTRAGGRGPGCGACVDRRGQWCAMVYRDRPGGFGGCGGEGGVYGQVGLGLGRDGQSGVPVLWFSFV